MNALEASRERARPWCALKPLLVRSLGRDGAAEWLAFAAVQMHAEAQRNVIELKPAEWQP